jgi:hypothetical protein
MFLVMLGMDVEYIDEGALAQAEQDFGKDSVEVAQGSAYGQKTWRNY